MKRLCFVAFASFVLIALVSCVKQVAPSVGAAELPPEKSESQSQPSSNSGTSNSEIITSTESTQIPPQVAENPETTIPDEGASVDHPHNQPDYYYLGYYNGEDPLRTYFITIVDGGTYVTRRAIGDQAQSDYLAEYREIHGWGKPALPAVYEMIRHFGVSKEEFSKYNDESIARIIENERVIDDHRSMFYQDWMIDALYCEDEEEMIRRLIVPSAMYRNGELFNIYDILDLDEAELEGLALTTEEWRKFTRNAEWVLTEYAPMARLEESMDTWAQRYSTNAAEYVYATQHENRSCLEVVEFKISEFEAQRNAVENPCTK